MSDKHMDVLFKTSKPPRLKNQITRNNKPAKPFSARDSAAALLHLAAQLTQDCYDQHEKSKELIRNFIVAIENMRSEMT